MNGKVTLNLSKSSVNYLKKLSLNTAPVSKSDQKPA
jgi:hypothetical protein